MHALRENVVWETDMLQNHGTGGPFQGYHICLLGCQNKCVEADWVQHEVLSLLMPASASSAMTSQPWCCQTQLVSLLYHPQYPTNFLWWGMPPSDISNQHSLNRSVLRKSCWLAFFFCLQQFNQIVPAHSTTFQESPLLSRRANVDWVQGWGP